MGYFWRSMLQAVGLKLLLIAGVSHGGTDKRGIVIFSAPRTTSTLLLRLLAEPLVRTQQHTQAVLLEPCTQAFYLQHQADAPGFAPQLDWPSDAAGINALVLQTLEQPFFVMKSLAYQCLPYLSEQVLTRLLERAHLLFLLRQPEKSILSGLYPYAVQGELANYRPYEAGFVELEQMFRRLRRLTHDPLWVMHAEEYLEHPLETVNRYLQAMGFPLRTHLRLQSMGPEDKERFPGYRVWGDTWYGNAFATMELLPRPQRPVTKYASLRQQAQELLMQLLPAQERAYAHLCTEGAAPP